MYGFENETYLKVLHGAVDNIEVNINRLRKEIVK